MVGANGQYDLLVVGGGVNGAGIARDAAGRGLRVVLCEQHDLASHTSSASTKLIHGGLRYLEYYQFHLVREALRERERLLRMAPHIIWPLRFVLPHDLHLRPAWMIRTGLVLYDHLGGHRRLPGSRAIRLDRHVAGEPLDPRLRRGFEYSDCWVQDARLVALDALDAHERGATIRTRTRCEQADRADDGWRVTLRDTVSGAKHHLRARCLVNAAGPWVNRVFDDVLRLPAASAVRLVKGSHIVVPRLYAHDKAYIFQNPDRRIIFAIPYERRYTLIGTTDVDYDGDPAQVRISDDEIRYLCGAANHYFRGAPVTPARVVWSYSGVRPLHADEHASAAGVTRDYALELDADHGRAPLLSVYGGKLTTHRSLAEQAMRQLQPLLHFTAGPWTADSRLPGGDLPNADFDAFLAGARRRWPWLPPDLAWRLARNYGTCMETIIGNARSLDGLGRCFGADLHECEVAYLHDHEWADTAEDILWRRSKLGLHFGAGETAALAAWLQRTYHHAAPRTDGTRTAS